jgi:hypothetical protein
MALQCCIGSMQIAVCMLHYAFLQRRSGDLQFALRTLLHFKTDDCQFGLGQLHRMAVQFVVCNP